MYNGYNMVTLFNYLQIIELGNYDILHYDDRSCLKCVLDGRCSFDYHDYTPKYICFVDRLW